MNHRKIFKDFNKDSLIFEQIIYIAAIGFNDPCPHSVKCSFTRDWYEIFNVVGITPVPVDINLEALLTHLKKPNKLGFLIQVAVPYPDEYLEAGKTTLTYNWINYTLKWFYVENFNDIFSQIKSWKIE